LIIRARFANETAPDESMESSLRIRVASVRLRSAIFSKTKEPLSSVGIWGRGRKAAAFYVSGLLHFANAGECSCQEYAQFSLDCWRSLGIPLKAKTVGVLKLSDMKNWIACRPVYSVLSTTKYIASTGSTPRGWRDAVGDYVREFVPR
jgi:dTDP-6-deoxy-L-lyxo-4-hexulose reductase RmlD-like protein